MPVADSAAMQVSTPVRRFVRRRRSSLPGFVKERAAREAALRRQLQRRLQAARERSDEVLGLVRDDRLFERPVPERHRLIFYLGHLEAFDANLLLRDSLARVPHRPDLDRLFAFGIDPVDGGLPQDRANDWPGVAEVRRYGASLRDAVDGALETTPLLRPIHPNLQDGWAFAVAIEHRLMHAETLAYLIHQLPCASKGPGPLPPVPVRPAPSRRLIEIPAGRATLGIERAKQPFLGWDNEYEAHELEVGAFAIERHDVTNGDYLAFVAAGGYRERSLWSEDDWSWLQASGREHPPFWAKRAGEWRYRAMFGEVPLGASWPVYVSHAEAAAYAAWRGLALPTEAQLHRAAYGTPAGDERAFPWGDAAPTARHGVFDFRLWDPTPVGTHPAGDSAFGVADLVGNGWEWTSTPFAPFPGFEALPFYAGYSADFFDGRHFVLKGGSPRTDTSLLRRSFRNWFQPHYSHAYATFRCVEDRG
jgi:iron(II)-dependent oxidoreductase